MTTTTQYTHLGFLQFDVVAGDPEANRDKVRFGLRELAEQNGYTPALVVLPELWSSGFDYRKIPAIAEKTPEILEELDHLAKKYQITIAGSLPEKEDALYYNTLFITDPSGPAPPYRKQHLFAPMGEDAFFTPGSAYDAADTTHGKIASLVCFDLRFPEIARNQAAAGADFLVISAQWPAIRREHWRILVMARAIENQLFVVACNRCGTTGRTEFAGHSMIVAPDGEILHEAGENEEHVIIGIDPCLVRTVRDRFSTRPSPQSS